MERHERNVSTPLEVAAWLARWNGSHAGSTCHHDLDQAIFAREQAKGSQPLTERLVPARTGQRRAKTSHGEGKSCTTLGTPRPEPDLAVGQHPLDLLARLAAARSETDLELLKCLSQDE